ncbi:MAG: MMPL family transporter [Thermoleophilia bacterium]
MQEALGGSTPLVGEFAFDPAADPATEVRRILAASREMEALPGVPVIWDDMARLVLRAQFGSLGMAFLLVVVMLFVAYRRVRETLVALAPLVLTVGVLLGFIAAADIRLNLVTAIVSSIVLGVGIDYAIHFIHGNISMLMWVSMSTAALAALAVIPALMPREGLRE